MLRLPTAFVALRFGCQCGPHTIDQNLSTKIGYVVATAVKLPNTISVRRAYSQTATVASSSSPSDTVKIYTGSLASKFWRLKFFSMSTSVLALSAQPVLIEKGAQMAGTAGVVGLCSVAGFFTFITPVLLHFVVKKYVTEMEHNPVTDEYTATTISLLMRKKKITFKVSDITIPEIPGMFTSFQVGKERIPIFVDAPDFNDLHHYARFMGFDKPVDFKLNPGGKIEKVETDKDAATKQRDVK